MKRKSLQVLLALALCLSIGACGKKGEQQTGLSEDAQTITGDIEAIGEDGVPVEEEYREGMYRSELTNEWIDESLKNQRPIAVMVDNETIALPHYGLTKADIVYEMMNSTANNKITRFMCLVKDWRAIEQMGSIRSARPTNFLLAAEWNAMLVHDGGPVYINDYVEQPYTNNLNGGFSRVDNGKPREYTEYILAGDMDKRLASYGYSTEYNEYYEGAHYHFASESNPVDLSGDPDAITAETIRLPFPHNKSTLTYDPNTQLYYYSEYGEKHLDPQYDNAQLSFKNVLLQDCNYMEFDEHGYMMFYIINRERSGYYITNGKAIEVTWQKDTATGATRYYDSNGKEITINTGKTYIGIVPDEDWENLVIE
ncbi:MAG: DUF3048 domain-containing protein [Clostridiales bacterium]|nr:DUF3048 domain-containing protein [Clostridiales bacterium]